MAHSRRVCLYPLLRRDEQPGFYFVVTDLHTETAGPFVKNSRFLKITSHSHLIVWWFLHSVQVSSSCSFVIRVSQVNSPGAKMCVLCLIKRLGPSVFNSVQPCRRFMPSVQWSYFIVQFLLCSNFKLFCNKP